VVGFGLADAITWPYPFYSYINYVWADITEAGHNFGALPWYWYLEMLCAHLGPIAFLVLMGLRRSPFLGWVALIILLPHNYFPHKEVRFLYPLMPLAITLAALGVMEVAPAFNTRRKSPLSSRAIVVGGLVFCMLSSCLLIRQFNWSRDSGGLVIFDHLSHDSTLCGLGLYRTHWADTGGYTHLHRNVPIVLVPQASQLEEESQN
jgi:phosphatidylinositol glycan class B